ncbi:MAG TPA: hypothetical protein V6D11_32355, partial [Waterburya sp.]
QLDSLSQQFNTRPETPAIAHLTEQVEALTQHLDHAPASQAVDPIVFEQTITEIATHLSALELRLDNLPTSPAVQSPLEEVATQQLQQQQNTTASSVNGLSSPTLEEPKPSVEEVASTGIQGQLESLNQQFRSRAETQAIKDVERAITQLTEHREAIAFCIEHLSAPDSVNQAIADIQQQLDTLNQQFRSRPETEAIEQLEGAIAQFVEISRSGDEEAIEDLNFQIDAMVLCLDNLPGPLQLDLGGVEQAMANIDHQLNNTAISSVKNTSAASDADLWGKADPMNQPSSLRLEAQAVEPLEKAITQLKEELNAAISYLENLPDPQDTDLWGDEDDISQLQW